MEDELLLEMNGVNKRFGAVQASSNACFSLRRGEIHALLGENGAGKTTLMNILFGIYSADSGEILYKGKPVRLKTPRDAIKHRIGMVHQHFHLIPTMTVLENIILGTDMPAHRVPYDAMRADAEALCRLYGFEVDLDAPVGSLTIGIQQRVEILKALFREADLLILDEPTAVLTPQEVETFFKLLRDFKAGGMSVIFISHKLNEVMEISDRITIMRQGESVLTIDKKDTSPRHLAETMVGRPIAKSYEKKPTDGKRAVLSVKNVSAGKKGTKRLDGFSLEVQEGEIVGIAGVDGNGQLELSQCIMGHRAADEGELLYLGEPIGRMGTRKRIENGFAYIPEDRHKQGLVLDFSVAENIALNNFDKEPYTKKGRFYPEELDRKADPLVESFDIRPADAKIAAKMLSGGNQQKVVLARELSGSPKFILANQPTRGLDIGATQFVHDKLMEARAAEAGVLLISADLEELLLLSDRVVVMYEGRVAGEAAGPDYDLTEIGLMMGGHRSAKERN